MSELAEPARGAREPAFPRPAATVILLRNSEEGRLQTFMVRRDPGARFAADAFVFPGGTVDEADHVVGGQPPCSGLTEEEAHRRLTERGGEPPISEALSLALHVAAVRELFEEAGILLARESMEEPVGELAAKVVERLARARPDVLVGKQALPAIALELGLELAPERLVYFSHWITPTQSPRRYDTRFFVVDHPSEQEATHCGIETVDGLWVAPAEMLARCEAGGTFMMPVTGRHLKVLSRFRTVGETLLFARDKTIRTIIAADDDARLGDGLDGEPW